MRNLSVVFLSRDGTARQLPPAGVRLTVKRLRWNMIGGPAECEIEATGPISARWELAELLRYGVEIVDEHGEAVWWGYLSRVEIQDKRITTAIDIETMFNAVRARYQLTDVEKTSEEATAWATDATSSGLYGLKGTEISLGNETALGAEAQRNRTLEQQRLPIPDVTLSGGGSGDAKATLRAVGWWTLLGWGYYSNAAGKEEYPDTGATIQDFGNAAGSEYVAQSFQIASATGWNASAVRLRMRKENLPTDNVIVEICADTPGLPVLGTATRPASGIPVNVNWVEFTLTAPVTLATGTYYWIKVRRSGALGADHCKIEVNEKLDYERGSLQIWNGSAWVARSPDADMPFQVLGAEDTSVIVSAVVTYAQNTQHLPLAGCYIEQTSGVTTSPYQDGKSTFDTIVANALQLGAAGSLAYLAQVERSRMVRLRRESTADAWYMTTDGRPRDRQMNPLNLRQIGTLAGTWGRLVNVVPANVDTRRVAELGRVFAEEVEYDPERDDVTIRARGLATYTGTVTGGGSPSANQVGGRQF